MIFGYAKRTLRRLASSRTDTERRIAKNGTWLFAAEIGSRAARGLLSIIGARMLGASGLGAFAYALALGGLLTFFEDAGIGMFVTREFARRANSHEAAGGDGTGNGREPSRESLFGAALVLKLVLLGIAATVFMAVGPLVASVPAARALTLPVTLVLVFDSLREFFFSVSRAEQRMQTESKVKLLTNVLVFAFGLAFMLVSRTPLALATGYAVGGAIGCLVIFRSVRRFLPGIGQGVSRDLLARIFRSAWPFTVLGISNMAIFSTDILFLGHYASPADVGFYSAANRLVQVFYVLSTLFASVTFPVMVQKAADERGFARALRKMILATAAMTVPLVLVMTLGSGLIIRVVFGAAYAPAAPLLAILALTYVPVFIGSSLDNAIFARDEQGKFVIANVVGMIINAALNLVLVPRLGAKGAAISAVVGISTITIITGIRMLRRRSGGIFS